MRVVSAIWRAQSVRECKCCLYNEYALLNRFTFPWIFLVNAFWHRLFTRLVTWPFTVSAKSWNELSGLCPFSLISHLKWFSSAWIRVLHFLHNWLLVDYRELVSLADQLLLELFLALGLQKLLSEGNVGEHCSKCPTELDGCLGAFLKKENIKRVSMLDRERQLGSRRTRLF